jgi:hypothetical protein
MNELALLESALTSLQSMLQWFVPLATLFTMAAFARR